jgi:hypothetical protein
LSTGPDDLDYRHDRKIDKIDKIASAIAAMNTAKVATCSVSVWLKPIRGRSARRGLNATLPAHWNYAGVHADTDDARGIDVVFICDNTLFQVTLPLGTSNVV